jgi:fused signal recognition particle receptor
MNSHPTLSSLSEMLASCRPNVEVLLAAAGIKVSNESYRKKKKRAKPVPQPAESAPEISAARERISEEELRKRIVSHNQTRAEIREKEKDRERRRMEHELSRGEEMAAEIQRQDDDRRRRREEELRDRLEAIQQRREKRELEHEVSKRRARRTQEEPNSMEVIKHKIEAQEREEEERRKQILFQIHQRYHAPVTEGVAEAQVLLDRSKELARHRAAEMRRHREEVDDSVQSFY